jgi:hypothetical protein
VSCLPALFPPLLPKMSVHLFCPWQKQQTYFYSHTSFLSPATLCTSFCLPLPWDSGLPWKTHTMVRYDFLELLPHLVCHIHWSTPALNWLLGTSQNCGPGSRLGRGEDWHGPPTMPCTCPNSTPTGEEGKQTGMHVHRNTTPSCRTSWVQQWWLPQLRQSIKMAQYSSKAASHTQWWLWHSSKAASHTQWWLWPTATLPKRDEGEKKHAQACIHNRRGNRPHWWAQADRATSPGHGWGQQCRAQACFQPHLTPKPDWPSPSIQFLSQSYGSQEALM